jgi:hypothetical protein
LIRFRLSLRGSEQEDDMKNKSASLASALVAAALAVATPAAAGGKSGGGSPRPISDFVAAQAAVGCSVSAELVGLVDPTTERVLFSDYGGVRNTARSLGLPTTYDGLVTERRLADGRTLVHVILDTTSALTWVSDLNSALQFGATPFLLQLGADPALGHSHLRLDFVHAQPPGGTLPTLSQLLFCPTPDQEVRSIEEVAYAEGTLHAAAGVPEGTPGAAQMTQVGLLSNTGISSGHPDLFPVEHVRLLSFVP